MKPRVVETKEYIYKGYIRPFPGYEVSDEGTWEIRVIRTDKATGEDLLVMSSAGRPKDIALMKIQNKLTSYQQLYEVKDQQLYEVKDLIDWDPVHEGETK